MLAQILEVNSDHMRHGSHQRSLRIPILLWDFFSKIYSQRSQEMGTISRGFASLSRIYEKYGDATGEVVTLIGCKKLNMMRNMMRKLMRNIVMRLVMKFC